MSETDANRSSTGEANDRREHKRQALLNAALVVFARDGFNNAKIDDVAAEAGIGKGTVYLYASSKLALLQDVVLDRLVPMVQEVERIREMHTGSAMELLSLQIRHFFKEILNEDRRKIFRLIMSEAIYFPEIKSFYVENVAQRTQAAIQATLQMGVETGEFRDIDIEFVPQSIFGGVMAAGMWRNLMSTDQTMGLDKVCETHLDIILNGLRRRQ